MDSTKNAPSRPAVPRPPPRVRVLQDAARSASRGAPAREQTLTTNRTVVVIIRQEGMSPYCELPDAANEINCTFSYEWFNEGGFLITGADGYRGLDGPSARTACAQAMWSAMGGWEEIDACARALLYYRFVVAPPVEGPQ